MDRYADGRNTAWRLTGFSKRTEFLETEFSITREQMIEIRPLFDVGDDHWMALGYEVTPAVWPDIERVLRCGPPDPGLDYFVEGYATDR